MTTIWMTYFLAALAASGIFVAAGRRSKKAKALANASGWQRRPIDPLFGEAEVDGNSPEGQSDVGATLAIVLRRLGPDIASQAVQIEVAAPTGLAVRMKRTSFTDLLEELLTAAIQSAPASRLMISATTHAERVYVAVTDDMPGADHAIRQGRIRGLMERVALRGGVLDVSVRPSEGTTMTLRLAAAVETEYPAPHERAQSPATSPDIPMRAGH